MTVFRNAGQWDVSNVWYEEGMIRRYDKRERLPQMQHIDWGLSVVKAELLQQEPPDSTLTWRTLFRDCPRQGKLAGYVVTNRFYEIGSPEGLRETEAALRDVRA